MHRVMYGCIVVLATFAAFDGNPYILGLAAIMALLEIADKQ